ncbi:hypothetical protein [Furfurilactobacillus entadae]|uniref:hypothetical protein n=1 Tax=Furfurilactobacillus entadae TaxID=2922307 RepID=UPI0035F0DE13
MKEEPLKTEREYRLKKFKEVEKPMEDMLGKQTTNFGKQVVELAKEKDLTYMQAYAGLEYAYELMHYHQNFLKAD